MTPKAVPATHTPVIRVRRDPSEDIREAIAHGLQGGWHKAHKYQDHPTPEFIWEWQARYIDLNLDELGCEYAWAKPQLS